MENSHSEMEPNIYYFENIAKYYLNQSEKVSYLKRKEFVIDSHKFKGVLLEY